MPPRIMLFANPPLPICLNILLICAYWRSSWFTSCTDSAGAGGDALAPRTGDDLVVAALLWRHGVDDGFEAHELFLIDVL